MGDVTTLPVTAPVPLDTTHSTRDFDCGKAQLNDWLRSHAIKNEGRASRCFVICRGTRVIGFYAAAAGSVEREKLPKKFQRNIPDPVPVVILARLAVDTEFHGQGLARALLKDAFCRILAASKEIGVRAVLVHAIDDDVVPFYAAYGFLPFPAETRTLFLPLETVAAGL